MIGQGYAATLSCDWHFEAIALFARRHRDAEKQASETIIGGRRENERGPMTGLFMTRLRVELDPDDVTSFRHPAARYHQISFPTGRPKSISG